MGVGADEARADDVVARIYPAVNLAGIALPYVLDLFPLGDEDPVAEEPMLLPVIGDYPLPFDSN